MHYFNNLFRSLFVLLILLSACGEDENPEPVGAPPVADAGADLNAATGSSVTLDGSGTDPDGGSLTYAWALTTVPDGSGSSVTSANQATATFVPDVPGTYVATLSVTDAEGNVATDAATITAAEAVGQPPVVVIVSGDDGRAITADNGNNVVPAGIAFALDGSNTADPDTEKSDLTFTWEVIGAPDNSSTASIAAAADNTDEAAFVPDVIGTYVIRLTVSDPEGNSASSEVTIEANASPVIIDSNISTDTTWPNVFDAPDAPDYFVTADIDVTAVLTVAPGVKVIFEPNRGLSIEGNGGALTAVGTADSLIEFTAEEIDNGWDGIVFFNENAQNQLKYAEVSYGGRLDFGFGIQAANIGIDGNGGVTVANTQVTHSNNYGIFVENGGKLREFADNSFTNNGNNPLALSLSQAGQLDENSTFSDNTDNAVQVYASTLNQDEELVLPALANNVAYYVSGRLDVDTGLKAQPGVTIEFGPNAFVEVSGAGGYWNAEGTAADSIVFTARNQADGWGGISVYTSSSRNNFTYARVDHGGNRDFGFGIQPANIGIDSNGQVKISNSVVSNSVGTFGLFVEGGGDIESFSENRFSGNSRYSIGVPINAAGALDAATNFVGNGEKNNVNIYASALTTAQTLAALANDAAYYVSGKLDIDNSLEIAAGATLLFNKDVRMEVSGSAGSLEAVGTAENPITMTADVSSDGWLGIVFFTNTTANKLIHTEVSYGGRGSFGFGVDAANVGVDSNGKVALSNSRITNSQGFGVYVEGGGTVTNATGVALTTEQAVIDAGNTLADNTNGATNL